MKPTFIVCTIVCTIYHKKNHGFSKCYVCSSDADVCPNPFTLPVDADDADRPSPAVGVIVEDMNKVFTGDGESREQYTCVKIKIDIDQYCKFSKILLSPKMYLWITIFLKKEMLLMC